MNREFDDQKSGSIVEAYKMNRLTDQTYGLVDESMSR